MIKVSIHRNSAGEVRGFILHGHAGYAEEGQDIVCSAVTILVFNTLNCIEAFVKEKIEIVSKEETGGYLKAALPEIEHGKQCHDAALLLDTMVYGLKDIEKEYSDYIQVRDKEVHR